MAASIVVIGDLMIDRWIDCKVTKVSQEAPVVIGEQVGKVSVFPGGAANLARNILSMGGDVLLISSGAGVVIDSDTEIVHMDVDAWLDDDYGISSIISYTGDTTTKTRFVADGHQIYRWDDDYHLTRDEVDEFEELVYSNIDTINSADVVVIADYGKGCIEIELEGEDSPVHNIISGAQGWVIIDPYPTWSEYVYSSVLRSVDMVDRKILMIPNEQEIDCITAALLEYLKVPYIIKKGKDGCDLHVDYVNGITNFPSRATGVNSVVGAGDIVDAAIAVALAEGASMEVACRYAMDAAANAVKSPYTCHATLRFDYLTTRR